MASTRKLPEPGHVDQLQAFLLSTAFQTGLQLATGELLLSFFFWHRSLRYRANCPASTLYLVGSLLVAQNNHLGSKVLAAACVLGSTWLSAFVGASMVCLARLANNHGFTPLLCVLGLLGLVPFAAIRSSSNPVVANGFGVLATINYGTVIIQGQFLWPPHEAAKTFWNLLISHLLLDGCIVAGCIVFSSVGVLPTLAGNELRALLAQSVRGISKSVSSYGTHIFAPEDPLAGEIPGNNLQTAATVSNFTPGSAAAGDEGNLSVVDRESEQQRQQPEDEEEDEVFLTRLQAYSAPSKSGLAQRDPLHHSANAVRPLLEQARAAIVMSGMEPAWLHGVPIEPAKWTAVINAVDTLVTHVAACEMWVDERHLMQDARRSAQVVPSMQPTSMQELAPCFKLVFAQVATTCAVVADMLTGVPSPDKAARLRQQDWRAMQATLHAELQGAMRDYAHRLTAISQQTRWAPLSTIQLRALAFATTLCCGIIASMDKLEAALAAALPPVAHGAAAADVEAGKPPLPLPDAMDGAKLPARQAGMGNAGAGMPTRGLKYYFGFLLFPLKMIASLPACARIWEVFSHTLPNTLINRKARASLLTNRTFHFAAKYWLACACIMVTVVILQQEYPTARHWQLQYPFLTIPIVFGERVEITMSKGFLRVLGTSVGGALGLLVMFNTNMATKAVPLAVIVVFCTFVAGVASHSPFKVAVILTIITFNVQILCQFVGCCGAHGTVQYFATQVIGISAAVGFAILINNCILPWYATSSALGMLGSALKGSGQLLGEFYEAFHQAVKASAAAASVEQHGHVDVTAAPVKLPAASAIRTRIGQPLGTVQTMLAKEQVAWTFQRLGIMTMPPIVHTVLGQLLPLMDRLSALELSVSQHPAITGAFHSSAIWAQFVQPLDAELRETFRLAQAVAQSAAQVLEGSSLFTSQQQVAAEVNDLRGSVQDLELQRAALRKHYLACRREYHSMVTASVQGSREDAKLAESGIVAAPDDVFRFQSWLFGVIKVLDKLTLVGKTVAEAGDRCRPSTFAWLFAEAAHMSRPSVHIAKVSQIVRLPSRNIIGQHAA